MSSISGPGLSPQTALIAQTGNTDAPRSTTAFKDALVKPESSGSSSWFNPKVVASNMMAVGRWSLGIGSYIGTTVTASVVGGTLVGSAKLLDGVAQLRGFDQLLPDTTTLLGQTLQGSHDLGWALSSGIVSTLAPLEADPDKIFGDRDRVGELSRMFDDVQGNEGVPRQQKNILALMDGLGDHAYRKTSETDDQGRPVYKQMTKEEYRAALLHGAHVVVEGNETLDQIKAFGDGGMTDRSGKGKSSHYTTVDGGVTREQWGMDLPMEGVGGPGGNGFGHLLTGTTSHGDTFFQLEGHGTKTWTQWAQHGMDLFTHLNSLANVGPHGVIDMVEGSQTHIIIRPQ